MKKVKKILAVCLTVFFLIGLLPNIALAATVREVSNAIELTTALGSYASGDTIKLMNNINYSSTINIDAKTLIIDTNGYTFDLVVGGVNALSVINGGVLEQMGGGAINIVVSSGAYNAVYAENGGKATVTNATTVGTSCAVCATGTGSSVTVLGDATAYGSGSTGVLAESGGKIEVTGDASGVNQGAEADDSGSSVIISGNATATGSVGNGATACLGGSVQVSGNVQGPTHGAYAYNSGSIVKVTGDATSTASGSIAAETYDSGTVEVSGNAIATGSSGSGATASSGGSVQVNGYVVGPTRGAYAYNSGSIVKVTGDATATAVDSTGVETYDGASIEVGGNATGDRNGVYALNSGSHIKVTGDATATGSDSYGAYATNNATIEVGGMAKGGTGGATADDGSTLKVLGDATGSGAGSSYGAGAYRGSTVEVGGDAYGHYSGAQAYNSGSIVKVTGDATGNGDSHYGVYSYSGGSVEVGGNVTQIGTSGVGVYADGGSNAKIEGTITAPVYINLQGTEKLKTDGVKGTGSYAYYWMYSDASNNVYVKTISAALSSGSAAFDLNPTRQADVSTTITWNEALTVADIKANGTSIGAGSYSLSGSALTIKKEYLAGKAVGSLPLSVEFDVGEPSLLTITINNSVVPVSINCVKTNAPYYGSNGTVTINASGGNSGTFQYSINSGASWQETNVFEVAAGTYTAMARDASNTSNTASQIVSIGQVSLVWTGPANKMPTKANAGTAITITPPASPRGYTFAGVTYSSTNPAIATVNALGNVTFLAGGKTTIITRVIYDTLDRYGHLKTKITTIKKSVTVKQPVSAISLSQSNANIARTQKVKLTASISPATASNKKLTWKSSNPKVASVSSSGVIVGKKGGTAVITCTAKDGSGISASCTVTVTPIYPTSITFKKPALSVKLGKTASLKANVSPKNTDFKTVTWASSNPAVISVDAKGKVKALASGTAVITATTSNGIIASCTVTVP